MMKDRFLFACVFFCEEFALADSFSSLNLLCVRCFFDGLVGVLAQVVVGFVPVLSCLPFSLCKMPFFSKTTTVNSIYLFINVAMYIINVRTKTAF